MFAEKGQATVELAVLLPVLLTVALIVMNAVLFLSECAAFDRLVPQVVRVQLASPAYGQDLSEGRLLVKQRLDETFSAENLSVEVEMREVSGGLLSLGATLVFQPTLFGLGLRSEVFGIPLPSLSHTVTCVVDRYKPGVIV